MDKVKASQLIEDVAYATVQPRKTVKSILEAATEQILGGIHNGKAVVFPGLGVFQPRERAERKSSFQGRTIVIPPRRVLFFQPAKNVRVID